MFRMPMKLRLFAFTILLFLMACSTSVTGPSQDPKPKPQETPEDFSYLAVVNINATQTREQLAADYDGTVLVYHPDDGFAIIGLSSKPEENSFESLKDNGLYSTVYGSGFSAWAGGWRTWAGGWSAWAGGTTNETTFTENEAFWSQIKLPEGQALAPKLGEGMTVAVIDTGLDYLHPGFKDHLASAAKWKDFVDGDTLPQEAEGSFKGHGTAVAGLIIQVAPKAKILPIRVLDGDGQGDLVSVIQGIDHAIMMGADVINLSLGASGTVDALERMIGYARDKGIPMVASVGNQGEAAISHPANWDSFLNYLDNQGQIKTDLLLNRDRATVVTAVSSINSEGVKSSFANYGPVHIAAPGEGVLTLYPGEQIVSVSGTSFSAAIVSGTYALAKAQNPKMQLSAYASSLIVSSTASWTPETEGYDSYYRWLGGVLDVKQFLQIAPITQFFLTYIDNFSVIPSIGLDGATCTQEAELKSEPSEETTRVLINNMSAKPHKVYRLNESGQRDLITEIAPQRIWRSVGYSKDIWLVASETGECQGIVTNPQALAFLVIGNF